MAHEHAEVPSPAADVKDIAALRNEGQPYSPSPAAERPLPARNYGRNFDRRSSHKPSPLNQSSASSNAHDEIQGSTPQNPVIIGDSNEDNSDNGVFSDLLSDEFSFLPDITLPTAASGHSPQTRAFHIPDPENDDIITDTVGAIAIDSSGKIAAGSSSGGIGMKYKGRIGPAALVGVGSAVIPINPRDKDQTCVAAVTSGTGEHMATTMAASTCANRLYNNQTMSKRGVLEDAMEEEAIQNFIKFDFMSLSK